MNNIFYLKSIGLLLFCLVLGCSAQTDEERIYTTMEKWKHAFMAKDIDAIVEFYSDDFTSRDANGKEGMRLMLQEAIAAGMLDKIKINLENVQLKISDGVAEFIILDENEQILMDFALKSKDGKTWLITGIPSEICSYDSYKSPYGDACVQHGGYYRCWDIYVPPGITGSVPLVVDIHGWESSPAEQRSISGFESLAKTEGFIIVWPYGICESWNSGEQCCPPASEDKIDDVGFIRELVTKVSGKHNIDLNRVYLTGLSNGCSMTQRLANEASDIIAAAACMSLHLLVPEDPAYSPVSVMTLLGTKDDLYYANEEMPGAVENLETWKNMNNCKGTYRLTWESGKSFAWTYTDCENGSEVSMVSIDEGGHSLYKGENTEINTTRLAWDFMKRFSK